MEIPTRIDVCQINEQGHDLIIAPMQVEFDTLTNAQRADVHLKASSAAKKNGLSGTVVLMWTSGSDTTYLAPGIPRHIYEAITHRFAVACAARSQVSLSW